MTDIELIKSKLDIVDFLSSYISLKKAGRNFKALCPFHSEKTPSFVVSPDRQTWHCFGSCATGGDVITFYEKWENVDFLEALKVLAEKTGVRLQKFTADKASELKETLYAINNLSSDFFHFLLSKHKIGTRARDYLEQRKIKKEIIKTFQIGYAPESWDSLNKYLNNKGYKNPDLEAAGLIIKSERGKYYDRFRGRIIFPLKDQRGKIIGFSGRLIPGERVEEKGGAKYINSPETALYIKGNNLYGLDQTKESIRKEKIAIIVEGEFDFLASFEYGVTNVVAIKGSALTENQSLLIKRYADSVYLALDADFAGNEAARRGIEIAENAGLSVKVISLLKGKDPAECIEAGAHFWKKSVEGAIPVYDFIIKSALKKFNPDDVNGKKDIAEEVVPFLSKIQNPIILSHYIKSMAKDLKVNEESIEQAIEMHLKKKTVKNSKIVAFAQKRARIELLEEYFLTLILQNSDVKNAMSTAFKFVSLDDFREISIKNLLQLIDNYLSKNEDFEIKKFNQLISPEMAPVFDLAYLKDIGNIQKDSNILKETIQTAKAIKKIALRREINQLSTQLSQIDDEQNIQESIKLREKMKDILVKLKDL